PPTPPLFPYTTLFRSVRLPIAHAARELDHRELGHEHGARLLETTNHRPIVGEASIAERRGAPCGRDAAGRRQQVFRAVGDAVQRSEEHTSELQSRSDL